MKAAPTGERSRLRLILIAVCAALVLLAAGGLFVSLAPQSPAHDAAVQDVLSAVRASPAAAAVLGGDIRLVHVSVLMRGNDARGTTSAYMLDLQGDKGKASAQTTVTVKQGSYAIKSLVLITAPGASYNLLTRSSAVEGPRPDDAG
jgi:hypothetical protein